MKSFTANEFAEKLAEGSLKQPIRLTGMVKKSEKAAAFFLFSNAAWPGEWVEIPHDLVENVEWLRMGQLGEETVAHIRMVLKEPNNREAAVFAQLLRHTSTTASHSEPTTGGVSLGLAASPAMVNAPSGWGHRPVETGSTRDDNWNYDWAVKSTSPGGSPAPLYNFDATVSFPFEDCVLAIYFGYTQFPFFHHWLLHSPGPIQIPRFSGMSAQLRLEQNDYAFVVYTAAGNRQLRFASSDGNEFAGGKTCFYKADWTLKEFVQLRIRVGG